MTYKMIATTRRRTTLDYAPHLTACATAAAVAAWIIVVWGLWRGIDLTDEGYYLNSMSLPFRYKATYSQFGFLLHPIYVAVGGDLILLRLVGVLLLALAAAFFLSAFLDLPVIRSSLPRTALVIVAVGGACTVLLGYSKWIPTPNFNSLNLVGVLIIFGGWLRMLAMPEDAASQWTGRPGAIFAFAVGFAIVALAKPTTAAVLAIGLTGLTLPSGRRAVSDVVFAGILSFFLVLLVLLAIDADFSKMFLRYRESIEYNELFQAGHDLNSSFAPGAIILLGFFGAYWYGRRSKHVRGVDRRYVAILAALILAPIAIAFGTNTGILRSAPRAGVFWVIAIALAVAIATPPNIRLPLLYFVMAGSACGMLIVLVHAIQKPYRLNGPLWQQTEWISSAARGRVVKVDPATADYFRTLQNGAGAANFQVGTPIIDLSGMGPTTIYILGGEAVGLAWINGGYPGSRKLTQHVLASVPGPELRRSWILTAPGGHGEVPSDVLNDVGLAFPDHYVEVARAKTGYMNEEQILWRPRNAETTPAASR
jgi:hypothetical protein